MFTEMPPGISNTQTTEGNRKKLGVEEVLFPGEDDTNQLSSVKWSAPQYTYTGSTACTEQMLFGKIYVCRYMHIVAISEKGDHEFEGQ